MRLAINILFCVLALIAVPATAQVKVAAMPPYTAMSPTGEWSGPAVDLYLAAAQRTGTSVEFVKAPPGEAAFPVYVSASTPGADTDRTIPFHIDRIGLIGVSQGSTSFVQGLIGLVSWGFLKVAAIVAGLMLIAGTLFWLVERRGNDPYERQKHGLLGIGNGFWWAGVTATTIGYGDVVPRTRAGRALAMVWMFFSMALTALLTAYLVSLTGKPSDNQDFAKAISGQKIGIIEAGAVATGDLAGAGTITQFASLPKALSALDAGQIDAVAYPYTIAKAAIGGRDIIATSGSIALPAIRVKDAKLRAEIDRIILTPAWQKRMLDSYSGE